MSEMVGHMALIREFYSPSVDLSPGMVGLVGSESLFTHLKNRKMVTEKYLARHFSGIQQFLEGGELGNVYWLLGPENPADGVTEIKSDALPILNLLESGCFKPGVLKSLKGIDSNESANQDMRFSP